MLWFVFIDRKRNCNCWMLHNKVVVLLHRGFCLFSWIINKNPNISSVSKKNMKQFYHISPPVLFYSGCQSVFVQIKHSLTLTFTNSPFRWSLPGLPSSLRPGLPFGPDDGGCRLPYWHSAGLGPPHWSIARPWPHPRPDGQQPAGLVWHRPVGLVSQTPTVKAMLKHQ